MTDLSGIGAGVSACIYYASQGATRQAAYDATTHTCLANLRALKEPAEIELSFDPVTLDETHRNLVITVGIRYDKWFDGIAMDLPADTPGAGGQVRRWSSENPNPLRPFPDKDVVPASNPKVQCSTDAACTAEWAQFMTALEANIAGASSFEISVEVF